MPELLDRREISLPHASGGDNKRINRKARGFVLTCTYDVLRNVSYDQAVKNSDCTR